MAVAVCGMMAVGCNDLDMEPQGSVITSDQKAEVLAGNPEMAQAAVNALHQGTHLINVTGEIYGQNLHNDFGYASIAIGLDCRGIDSYGPNDGYNWYASQSDLKDWAPTYFVNLEYWNTNYGVIKSSNTLIAGVDEGALGDDINSYQLRYFLGQGYAYRAFAYYYLVNMYQQTYAMNPDAPCVPILTDQNMDDAAANGNPRATVRQVWDLVKADVTKAINYLTAAEKNGNYRPDKRYFDTAAAYGLRARANLFTQNWAQAVSDADSAIMLASAHGITPYSQAEAAIPNFYNLADHNVMLGVQNLASDSYTQGVVNFASMMSGWMPNGYGAGGCVKRVSKKLYAAIPATDVRINWFIRPDGTAPATLPAAYAAYVNANSDVFFPYANVKFGAANNTPGEASGAVDFPLMRVEEMYLIKAEAQGKQSPATGAATLNAFVQTYRDPSFVCMTDAEGFQNSVWMQRRIELWGEGFSYFDLMRLQKGIDRRGMGIDPAWVYVLEPTNPVMRYQIVQPEYEANSQISEQDVLEGLNWIDPTPVADEN